MMLPQLVLHAEQRAEHIGVEGGGIAFRGLVRDRAGSAFGAGIVHCNIEAPEALDGPVDQGADVIFLADVGIDELGLRTKTAQLLSQRFAGLIAPTGNDNFRAPLGEGDGGGAPDTGKSTCDQDDGVTHGSSPSWCGVGPKMSSPEGLKNKP